MGKEGESEGVEEGVGVGGKKGRKEEKGKGKASIFFTRPLWVRSQESFTGNGGCTREMLLRIWVLLTQVVLLCKMCHSLQ